MTQEQQHFGLFFRVEAVEPFASLGHRTQSLREFVEQDIQDEDVRYASRGRLSLHLLGEQGPGAARSS